MSIKMDFNIYKKILVAVDLSKHSKFPMERAVQLASTHSSSLDVVHVISMVMPYFSYSFSSEIQDVMYNEAKHHFTSFCEQYEIPKTGQHLLIGSPRLQILDLIEKLNVDLLVVGNHGDHHILPANFGSTPSSILAKAKCDVLTISIHPIEKVEGELYDDAQAVA